MMTVEARRDGSTLIIQGMDRIRFPGWGVFGGRPAAPFRIVLNKGRPEEKELSRLDRLNLNAGDTVTIMMPGGSGYGDPFERDPEAVMDDLRLGFVTRAGAKRDFGVVATNKGLDRQATEKFRTTRIRQNVRAEFDFGSEREAWERVFDDATLLELNRQLMTLPRSQRFDKRRWIFEQVVPDMPAAGMGRVAAAIGDPDEARARLADAMGKVFGNSTESPAHPR